MGFENEFKKLPNKEQADLLEKRFLQVFREQKLKSENNIRLYAELVKQRLEKYKDEIAQQKKVRYEKGLPEMLMWLKDENEKIEREFDTIVKQIARTEHPLLKEKNMKNTEIMLEIKLKLVENKFKNWLKEFE